MAFKMKRSPAKSKLGDFFSSLGKKATPETRAKRAEAKKTRKAGESQYQADVRTRGEASRAKKLENKKDAAYYGSDSDKMANSEGNKKTSKSITTPKKGGGTQVNTKVGKGKVTGYENAKSVNALVAQRTIFNKDPKNKGKTYPGQAEINKRLKEDPKKFA